MTELPHAPDFCEEWTPDSSRCAAELLRILKTDAKKPFEAFAASKIHNGFACA